MKKTLYVSDMDGTLLNAQGELSAATRQGLNRIIDQGGLFAVATARSPQSARPLVTQLNLNIPSIFINGVMLYDVHRGEPVETKPVEVGVLPQLLQVFERCGSYGYMYAWNQGSIDIFYRHLPDQCAQIYYEQRMRVYDGRLYQSGDYIKTAAENDILYYVMYGDYAIMKRAFDQLKQIPQVSCSLYQDSYHPYYFIDIVPSAVSKATGIQRLGELVGADEIVAFGDNYNDLPMLKAADRAYVVENGVDEAKQAATGVIGACNDDGVVRFILQDFQP